MNMYFFYRHNSLVAIIGIVLAAAMFFVAPWAGCKCTTDCLLMVIGIIMGAFYFFQKHSLEHLKVFRELFKEFTKMYDTLDAELNRIVTEPVDKELGKDDQAVLSKYLDLCCEEYFFHQQHSIYPKVWRAWCQGMLHFYNCPRIGRFWDGKLRDVPDAYYGFNIPEIKKNARTA
jgi:hypothetical protein